MEKIWQKVCHHYDVPDDVANKWFQRLKERLDSNDSTRSYHNWNEILVNKVQILEKCKPHIVLAALFQYYEFDGKRCCIEENCVAFQEFCRDALIDDEESKTVVLKLLGEKTKDGELTVCFEDDANLLQDIDLCVLGSSPEEYQKYSQHLRKEYNHLSDDSYKQMRVKVLEALLMIPQIFSTTEFQNKYEASARANIQNEINELKG